MGNVAAQTVTISSFPWCHQPAKAHRHCWTFCIVNVQSKHPTRVYHQCKQVYAVWLPCPPVSRLFQPPRLVVSTLVLTPGRPGTCGGNGDKRSSSKKSEHLCTFLVLIPFFISSLSLLIYIHLDHYHGA